MLPQGATEDRLGKYTFKRAKRKRRLSQIGGSEVSQSKRGTKHQRRLQPHEKKKPSRGGERKEMREQHVIKKPRKRRPV